MSSIEAMKASGKYQVGASCFVKYKSGQVEKAELDELLWADGKAYVIFPQHGDDELLVKLSDVQFTKTATSAPAGGVSTVGTASAAQKKKLFDDFAGGSGKSSPKAGVKKTGAAWKPQQQERCVSCEKVAYLTERIVVEKQIVHKSCFLCTVCKSKLKPTDFAKAGKEFYCKPHFKQLLAAAGGKYEQLGANDSTSAAVPVKKTEVAPVAEDDPFASEEPVAEPVAEVEVEAVAEDKPKKTKTITRTVTKQVKKEKAAPAMPSSIEEGLSDLQYAAESKEGFNLLIGYIRKALKDAELSKSMSKEIKAAKKHVLALNRATTALNKAVDDEDEVKLEAAIAQAEGLGLKREVLTEAREVLAELRGEEMPVEDEEWTEVQVEEEIEVTDDETDDEEEEEEFAASPAVEEEEQAAPEAVAEEDKPQPKKINTSFFEAEIQRAGQKTEKIQSTTKKTFTMSSGPKCSMCNKTVYKVDELIVEKKPVHKLCFRCTKCKTKLKPTDFAKINKKYYCKPHFKQLLAEEGGKYSEEFGKEKYVGSSNSGPMVRKNTGSVATAGTRGGSKSKKAFFEQAAADNAKQVERIQGHSGSNFVAHTGPACFMCNKTVYKVDELIVEKKPVHKLCFRCTACQGKLKPTDFAQSNGKYYCKPHFKQLLASEGGSYDSIGAEVVADPAEEDREARRAARRAARRQQPEEEEVFAEEPVAEVDDAEQKRQERAARRRERRQQTDVDDLEAEFAEL